MDRKPGHLTRNIDNVAESLIWVKVVGVGDVQCGKTCLIKHFCESKFNSGYQATVGVDYGFKLQTVLGTDLRVHLWDLSGNAEYVDVRNELYGSTDGLFVVYDVTNQASFQNVLAWMKEVNKHSGTTPEIALVANKVDLKNKRVVSTAEGKKLASAMNLKYHETSCTNGDGVEKMFNELLTVVAKNKKISKLRIDT